MILCGYLKPQPVSSKVVPVFAVRNPFQGSTWQHWPHWSFCFTGAILASLKVVVVFRCFKSCSDTTIYFNLILQGSIIKEDAACPLAFAFPVSPVGSLLLHLATQLCKGARASLSVMINHLWDPWHAQVLLPKELKVCAASLPILGTRELPRNDMDVSKLWH